MKEFQSSRSPDETARIADLRQLGAELRAELTADLDSRVDKKIQTAVKSATTKTPARSTR